MKNFCRKAVTPSEQTESDTRARRRKRSQSLSAYLCLIVLLGSLPAAARANDAKPADERAAVTRLPDAAESKSWTEVASLVERGVGVDESQPDGMTALHWAVFHGDLKTIRLLVDSKCDVNATTRNQVTPLSIACQLGRADSVKQLLAAGADVNAVLPGAGVYAFDLAGATTGAEGQDNTLCYSFGTSGIDNDLWYSFTADCDGSARFQTCNLTTVPVVQR